MRASPCPGNGQLVVGSGGGRCLGNLCLGNHSRVVYKGCAVVVIEVIERDIVEPLYVGWESWVGHRWWFFDWEVRTRISVLGILGGLLGVVFIIRFVLLIDRAELCRLLCCVCWCKHNSLVDVVRWVGGCCGIHLVLVWMFGLMRRREFHIFFAFSWEAS